jgi:pheromone shutdown protein TraB
MKAVLILLAWLACHSCHAFTARSTFSEQLRSPSASHRSPSSSSALASAVPSSTPTPSAASDTGHSLQKASVTLVDPLTNVQVVLLGCFHGSQSSARDVQALLTTAPTQMVVLELCASRFDDMRKHIPLQSQQDDSNREDEEMMMQAEVTMIRKRQPWITQYVRMITKTTEARGLPAGIASAVLGLASGWQTGVAGLEPGLEFRTAVVKNPEGSDIILADQSVDETLQKLGALPQVAKELMSQALKKGWSNSFGVEADALMTAVFGSGDDLIRNHQLSLIGFLSRSPAAVSELMRLIFAPYLGLQALYWLMTSVFTSNVGLVDDAASTALLDTASTNPDPLLSLAVMASNFSFLLFCYLAVALPATRVIIRERDDRLTEGIQAACRLAAIRVAAENKDGSSSSSSKGRVVAVLGLLHVNGVAKRLLSADGRCEVDPLRAYEGD